MSRTRKYGKRTISLLALMVVMSIVLMPMTAWPYANKDVDCTDCHNNTPPTSAELVYRIGGVNNPSSITVEGGTSFEVNFMFDDITNATSYTSVGVLIGLPDNGIVGSPWPQPTKGTTTDSGTGLPNVSKGGWKSVWEASDTNGVTPTIPDGQLWIRRTTNASSGTYDMPTTHRAFVTNFTGSKWGGLNWAALDNGSAGDADGVADFMGSDAIISVPTNASGAYTVYLAGVGHHPTGKRSSVIKSFTINVTPPGPPAQVTGLVVTNPGTGDALNLSWNDLTKEDGYKVERALDGDQNPATEDPGTFTQIGTTPANVTTYSDTTVAKDTTYWYRVRGYNVSGNGPYSTNAVGTSTDTTPPAAPTGLTATPSDSTINLSWTASTSTDVAYYRIKRSASTGGPYTQIGTSTTTSYADATAGYGSRWYYVATAVDNSLAANESGNSNEATALTIPAQVTGLTVSNPTAYTLDLSWNDLSGEDGYKIKRSTTSGGPYTVVGTTGANVTTLTDTGLSPNTTYYYVVAAYNVTGDGADSTGASGKTLTGVAPPGPPSGLTTTPSASTINLSWTASPTSGVTYNIYRASTSGGYNYASPLATGIATTSYGDATAGYGSRWYYVVRAYDPSTGLESSNSNEDTALTIPAQVTGLTVSNPGTGTTLNLSWNNLSGEDGYKIKRSTTSGGPYTQVGTTGANVTTFTDTGLTEGTIYYYVVAAYNVTGDGADSVEASGTPSTGAGTYQGGYDEPQVGVSPHGGYTDTTDKCKTCHAVHRATYPGAEILLRSTVAEACVYCHISTTFTWKQVYDKNLAKYTTNDDYNHASLHYSDSGNKYAGCTSCHAVHGAKTIAGTKILRDNPGGTLWDANPDGAIATPVTAETDFCRDCHDGRKADGTRNALWDPAVSQCGQCHSGKDPSDIYPGALNTGNRWSHIMSNNLTKDDQIGFKYPVQVAWVISETCRKCHSGGDGTAANNFPHSTTGVNFLSDLHTAPDPLDLVCLDCHTDTGDPATATQGAGKTF